MTLLFTSFSTSIARRSIAKTTSSIVFAGRHGYASTTALPSATPVKLHVEWVAPQASNNGQDHTILFMHGLLGNGRNLKTFARNLVRQQSKYGSCGGGILMDLRGHGSSFRGNNEGATENNLASTFQDCAQDVHHTLEEFNAEESASPTSVIVGHSFGGRLALEYAATIVTASDKPLKAVWLLDTVPGEANASVDKVLAIITNVLEAHSNQGLTKKEMVQVLTNPPHNMDIPTAHWLAMSYDEKSGDNFGFDNNLVTRLKPEFANQDFMGLLRRILESKNDTKVHVVRGGKNEGWTIPILTELQRLQKEFPSTFHLHVLPSAGHNVHIDDLPGLLKLFAGR